MAEPMPMYHAERSVATEVFVRLTRQARVYHVLDKDALKVAFYDARKEKDKRALLSLLREVEEEIGRTTPFLDTSEEGKLADASYRKSLQAWKRRLDRLIR
ncbi:hypothetical protein AEP_03898 [Curvibacter sp. AEP1-3]|uniref:hypothetical protein n=1 Tax=Curvibacter sp. AEP1-3 TaxID=1844971 RepID=UPI000B3CE2C9|nr:hypothetical protein [Curvibacter sp. AEP1-3]ARV20815.1 hypothetical protein AEP_03898 [Curvibacter sp. AEP1-3]